MNNTQKAYLDMGLEPGTLLETVLARYKWLAKTWHPDRAGTNDDRAYYNEELKKINNAKDVIKAHFSNGGHRTTGSCDCRTDNSYQKSNEKQSSRDRYYEDEERRKREAERQRRETEQRQRDAEEAKRRDEERRRKAEEERCRKTEEDSQRKAAEEINAKAKAKASDVENAVKQNELNKSESMQWRVSVALLVTFIILCFVSIASQIISIPLSSLGKAISSNNSDTQNQQKKPSNSDADTLLPVDHGLTNSIPTEDNSKSPIDQSKPITEDELKELRERFRPDQIAGLKSDLYDLQFQLDRVQNQLKNVDADIATETTKAEENESKMADIQKQLGTDFIYSAADRRWHPVEYSGWQALSSMAGVARKQLEVLQMQKHGLELDSHNLQAKIDKNQKELQQL